MVKYNKHKPFLSVAFSTIKTMEDEKIISGNTVQDVWPQLEADIDANEYEYKTLVKIGSKEIWINIDIDPGGGFESGSELVQFKAPLSAANNFRFAIHDQDFFDRIGKFFGMEDVKIGYEDLDHHLIIKTNEVERVRNIFVDAKVREIFSKLESFDCGIHTHHPDGSKGEQPFLEMNINRAIEDTDEFRNIFEAFYNLLLEIDA